MGSLLKHLHSSSSHSSGRCIGLQTPLSSTATGATIGYNADMPELTCITILSIYQTPIHDDTATYSGAEGDLYEVSHAHGYTIDHLSYRSSISIVIHHYREVDLSTKIRRERHRARPWEVHSITHTAGEVIAIRHPNADPNHIC